LMLTPLAFEECEIIKVMILFTSNNASKYLIKMYHDSPLVWPTPLSKYLYYALLFALLVMLISKLLMPKTMYALVRV